MIKGILLIVALTSLGQILPSCGDQGGAEVIGWVEAKHRDAANDSYVVVINNIEYDVPGYFYTDVRVGDLVKWDGKVWTVVKRAGAHPPRVRSPWGASAPSLA